MMANPTQPSVNLRTILSESRRIINAHSRHFLALSVLFLLPLSFSLTVYPTLQTLFSNSTNPNTAQTILRSSPEQEKTLSLKALFFTICYSIFLSLLSLFASCSITFSVIHGFYGRPVKLIAAIRSVFTYFFPMLVTVLCVQAIVALIVGVFGLFAYLIVSAIHLVTDKEIDFSSPYLIGFFGLLIVGLVLVLMYIQVEWILVGVIVVAESGWGVYPIRRSGYLVKGMRGVSLSLLLFFGVLSGLLLWSSSQLCLNGVGAGGIGWKDWGLVLQIVTLSSLLTWLMLLSLAANVVLYMYCKALHGELAIEIAEEFAREYVSLPFDDQKVPHLVSVVYT